jgi:hypothetical protein
MLKRRIKSQHLWRITATVRRKRKLMLHKKKIFARHRSFMHHM